MLPIPPNRPVVAGKQQDRGHTRLPMRSICIVGAFVMLVGGSQRGWAQTESSEPARRSTSRFITSSQGAEHSLIAQPKAAPTAPATPKEINPSALAPPLSIGDYQNYIKRNRTAPNLETKTATLPVPSPIPTKTPVPPARKQLDAITDAKPARQPGSTLMAKAPQDLVLAAPSAVVNEPRHIAISVPPKSQLTMAPAPINAAKSERADT